jgi:DNA-binding transcriptional MerR regulator
MGGHERKPKGWRGIDLFDPDAALEAVRSRDGEHWPAEDEVAEAAEDRSDHPFGPVEPAGREPAQPSEPALPVPALAGDDEGMEAADTEGPRPMDPSTDADRFESAKPAPGLTVRSEVVAPEAGLPGVEPAEDSAPAQFETADDPRIPAGQDGFKIGEVARIVGVRPYVLRYWETEFASIEPDKTETGQRRYDRALVARLLTIKRLRHEAQLTVAQTKAVLQREHGVPEGARPAETAEGLSRVAEGVERVLSADGGRARFAGRLQELRKQVLDLLALVED